MMRNSVTILLAIIILWLIFQILLYLIFPIPKTANEFGDASGAINTIFSGLAFVGLIYTILLQREDLKKQNQMLELQKDVLDQTRKEVAEQTKSLAQQAKHLEVQARLQKEVFLGSHKPNIIIGDIVIHRYKAHSLSMVIDSLDGLDLTVHLTSARNNYFIKDVRLTGTLGRTFSLNLQHWIDPNRLFRPEEKVMLKYKSSENINKFSKGDLLIALFIADINNYIYRIQIEGESDISFGDERKIGIDFFSISEMNLVGDLKSDSI